MGGLQEDYSIMKIKYSIIIPSLNGLEGLKVTLPYMLSIDRNDFEIVVSDNCSTDGLWEYLSGINNPKLKIFKTKKRLPHSKHLNFAYSKSSGEWIGHIGDDDLILKNRFDVLDSITNGCELVVGSSLRYVWKDHTVEPENSIGIEDFGIYSLECDSIKGIDYYQKLINRVNISGGGCWMVNRKVYKKVVDKFGYFSPDTANVEFFSLRASAYFSKKVTRIDYPLFVNGRMNKSSGTTLHEHNSDIFDWSFENPGGGWHYCPIPTYSYCTISLDAALRVDTVLQTNTFSNIAWGKNCMGAFLYKAYGVDSTNSQPKITTLFYSIVVNYPIGSLYILFRRAAGSMYFWIKSLFCEVNIGVRYDFVTYTKSREYLKGDFLGVSSIVDFADWYIDYNERILKSIKKRG